MCNDLLRWGDEAPLTTKKENNMTPGEGNDDFELNPVEPSQEELDQDMKDNPDTTGPETDEDKARRQESA